MVEEPLMIVEVTGQIVVYCVVKTVVYAVVSEADEVLLGKMTEDEPELAVGDPEFELEVLVERGDEGELVIEDPKLVVKVFVNTVVTVDVVI